MENDGMDMTERVAEAMYWNWFKPETKSGILLDVAVRRWPDLPEDEPPEKRGLRPFFYKAFWRAAARAAIEAMREPTEAMQEAGLIQMPPLASNELAHVTEPVWQAMIDAALSP